MRRRKHRKLWGGCEPAVFMAHFTLKASPPPPPPPPSIHQVESSTHPPIHSIASQSSRKSESERAASHWTLLATRLLLNVDFERTDDSFFGSSLRFGDEFCVVTCNCGESIPLRTNEHGAALGENGDARDPCRIVALGRLLHHHLAFGPRLALRREHQHHLPLEQ